jgi:VIT1/CCC1 family predicted Fe2+/Mn2+ transporter
MGNHHPRRARALAVSGMLAFAFGAAVFVLAYLLLKEVFVLLHLWRSK